MKYRNPKWNPIEWRLLVTLGLLSLLWYCVPSSLFYDPEDVAIENGRVTVTRSFPLHPPFKLPIVRYLEVVRPINDDPPCIDTAEFRYRYNDKPTASWNISGWAERCMQGDFIWSARWTVKLWGIIPLRPVELSKIIKEETPS